ncbi:centrosomal protein of 164 kDa-like isoform X3 [Apis laboriosa]|uniref:centrosomal protein of 164 kDa-like isoform X3 n=1 Tax=Apis laboriosa TaxID=183418 RepID=UPI001CC495FD|nr:centrosomal protein of 164 kDa-like isoform X3 [Apis laboriosa]
MSISQESAATIVCKEIFDGVSHPSDEEVLEYARRLGIDPDTEPHLLSLAREGLMAALPKGWLPCFHETSGAWYYYQASTGTTTWQHPLDAVYKEMVEQARAASNAAKPVNARQISVEEDSKTTAKELESNEEATLPKEASSSAKESGKQSAKNNPPPTRIPTKLAPLKKLEKIDGTRKKDGGGQEKQQSRREDNPLATNRAGRDYTNLKFQDPRFYECPKLLETVASTTTTNTTTSTSPKQEIDLKEVLKRSESLSPRHEKDWEQLSSRFSSEENIIDIDKLSINALARSEKSDKFDKEKHPSQFGQQKELTLSGGGTMFLKSNRSRDTTPIHETGKLDEFRTLSIPDETNKDSGDKLKSILREKQSEDDDRPVDEERKSVRFDIEKEVDIKYTYSRSEYESESESDEHEVLAMLSSRDTEWSPSKTQKTSQRFTEESKEDPEDKIDGCVNKSLSSEKIEASKTQNGKIVGKRFVVRNVPENELRKKFAPQNVSEKEHRMQMTRDSLSGESLSRESSLDYTFTNKFNKIKNIDLVSKSETDYSDSELRRKNKLKVELPRNEQTDDDETSDFSKINQDAHDISRREGNETATKQDQSKKLEEAKAKLGEEHERDIEALRKEYKDKLEQMKKELEENFAEQKKQIEKNLSDKLEDMRRKMVEKEEREIQKLIAEMDEAKLENLRKVKAELEVCYEKERQEILANLKTELDERKGELLELRNQEMGKLENEYERDLDEEKLAKLSEIKLSKQHQARIKTMKKELDKEFDELRKQLRAQQRENITKITEEHESRLVEILRDFRVNEDRTRKMYKQCLEEIRADFSRDAEKEAKKQTGRAIHQESIEFEKMRCEKRLLQDKYMALKEKYMKLKKEVRSAIERRSRRKEGYTTASETERSTSTRTRTDRTESSDQNIPLRNTHSSSATTNTKPPETRTTTNEQSEELHDPNEQNVQKANSGFQKSAATSNAKNVRFHSDETSIASETNANVTTGKKNFAKKPTIQSKPSSTTGNNINNNNNNLENPVENIRKQLEKLEDLGDQLPSNETAYTLRYPFQDKARRVRAHRVTPERILLDFLAPANASSELEFFRHRIHVERDSVKRAREALRHQENVFQGRQRAWKQRSVKATLEQLLQEERELSDMEVNLHRTKSLLGEKVIHLRHLEQSLERVVNAKTNENDGNATKNEELTLSDMSSVSSGISSTDLGTDTFVDKPDHYQESTEIIASLENLNSEIREIWGVLNKRQDTNIPPPPTLMYSYLRWLRFHHLAAESNNIQGTFGAPNIQSNILSQLTVAQPPTPTAQNIIAQYGPNSGFTTSVCTVEKHSSNLMERTWNLRDWLRQACVEGTDQSRSNDSIKSSPQSIEKFGSKRQSLGDSSTRFVDVDSMYLHVFLNQFKKTCFR